MYHLHTGIYFTQEEKGQDIQDITQDIQESLCKPHAGEKGTLLSHPGWYSKVRSSLEPDIALNHHD